MKHTGINRMTFTGSPEVARFVAESCGRNFVPVKLELGGKGSAVLFDDVDVDQAAESLVHARGYTQTLAKSVVRQRAGLSKIRSGIALSAKPIRPCNPWPLVMAGIERRTWGP